MKTKMILLTAIALCLLIGCEKKEIDGKYYCDEKLDLLNSYINMPRPEDSYNYPIRPCMDKWKKLASTEEKTKACEIPTEIVKNMSTQAVIQAIWEYPLLVEITSSIGSRDAQKDFESMFYNNNAYKELLLRNDAGKLLLNRYKIMDAICKEKLIWIPPFELLLSQPNFIQQLTTSEKKKLVTTALEKNKLRVASGYFDKICEYSTLILIARTMINENYLPFRDEIKNSNTLKRFIDTSMLFAESIEEIEATQQLIINQGKDFIK